MKFIYLIGANSGVNIEFLSHLESIFQKFHNYIYAFQLRVKEKSTAKSSALLLKNICSKYHVPFIVNDFLDIAKQCNADGIHVGACDINIVECKKVLGNKIIGISCYNNVDFALSQEKYVTYVSFGCFFKSITKPNPVAFADHSVLISWKKESNAKIPCVAIGGIGPENFLPLIHAGSDIIALSSSIWQARNPITKIKKMIHAYRHQKH